MSELAFEGDNSIALMIERLLVDRQTLCKVRVIVHFLSSKETRERTLLLLFFCDIECLLVVLFQNSQLVLNLQRFKQHTRRKTAGKYVMCSAHESRR